MEKINLKDKICLVVDNGQFSYMAQHLAKSFKKVYYYKSYNAKGFPSPNEYYAGYGLDGVTHIHDIFEKSKDYDFDKIDLFCFFDLYYGFIQEHLVSLGKRVWGAKSAEEIELDRWSFKTKLKEFGLPVSTSKKIIGVDALVKYIKEHDNVWVKISRFRGLRETFKSTNYETSKYIIDEIRQKLGALQKIFEFIVEDKIDAIFEHGYDGFNVWGQYPNKNIYGIEIKDCAYCCKVICYEDLPKDLKEVNKKFASYFKEKKYACEISTENRYTKGKTSYFIDITSRRPEPPGAIYPLIIDNLAEMYWYGGEGILVEPIFNAKYAVEIIMNSDDLGEGIAVSIEFPKKYENNVSLRYGVKIDGVYSVLPQGMTEVGQICATGNTLKEAIENVKIIAESVNGNIKINLDKLDSAVIEVEKTKIVGINF